MKNFIQKFGSHIIALILFIALVTIYFEPGVIGNKSVRQGDSEKAEAWGGNQLAQFEESAQPGEFSVWSDAMFCGMPYVASYGNPAPKLPSYEIIDNTLKKIGYMHAGQIFVGLICFYILMCIMGVNRWLAIAGAIAFAFASYNIIIINAGHVVKGYVIGYMPLTLAGMGLLFKKKYLWGAVVFLLGVAFSLGNGHIQITYYLVLLCIIIFLSFSYKNLKEKTFKEWGKTTSIMALCTFLAVLPNTKGMYSNWELGQHSIRGKSELSTTSSSKEKVQKKSTGLDKDYAFQWSYGWGELLTLIVPNAYGGSSGGNLDSDTPLYKALQQHNPQLHLGDSIRSYTYWGDKPFTSGPVYFGALICFLFVLGLIVIENKMKYALLAGALLLTALSLGRNFDSFNDFMFNYLPLYNKFRTVEMALVIPGLIFPIIAMWGLHNLFNRKIELEKAKKAILIAMGITGGLCLIIWLIPSLFLSFKSNYDSQFINNVPNWYYDALIASRATLASNDALRSLLFILIGGGLIFFFIQSNDIRKNKFRNIISISIAILILFDLWNIDRRYLNDSNFINETPKEAYKASLADKEIMKDKTLSYRVMGLQNPWSDTNVSFFHHSLGGYHAAKMRRYQELIDHRLNLELGALQQYYAKESNPDFNLIFKHTKCLNMLNMRYLIVDPNKKPILNNSALGNAWFVQNIQQVPNADAEIASISKIEPASTAIIDKRFINQLKGFKPQIDSTATIKLTTYRPNKLTYQSNSKKEQVAIFSEIYYNPGWQAYIDGTKTPHFRTNWILRGLRIPAGEHTIVFEFRPRGYVLAANISSFSSFFILILLICIVGFSVFKIYKKN